MTPWRSREYLDLSYVEEKTCVRCGRLGCEPCHYSGVYSDRIGKGGAQKSFDAAVADLCRECHVYFDLYAGNNEDERAAEFMMLVLVTLHRNLQNGFARLVVINPLRGGERCGIPLATAATIAGAIEGDLLASATTRRRKKSRCTAAANQVKRPQGGFSP